MHEQIERGFEKGVTKSTVKQTAAKKEVSKRQVVLTWVTVHAYILIVIAVRNAPWIMSTINHTSFISVTCNIVQPDCACTRAIVSVRSSYKQIPEIGGRQ